MSFHFISGVSTFAFVRFMSGVSFSYMLPIPATISVEILDIQYRGKISLFLDFFQIVGRVLVSCAAFIFLDSDFKGGAWRLMMISPICLNIVALIGSYFWLRESPRFLIANG